MSSVFELGAYIAGFFVLGMLVDYMGNELYWKWQDWKSRRENK